MQTHLENKNQIDSYSDDVTFTRKILKQQLLITEYQLAQCYNCADECNFGRHHNSFPELHRFWIGQISTHILCPILDAHFKKDSEKLEQRLRRMIREPEITSYELKLKGMGLFKLLWCGDMIVCFRFLKGCHREEAQLLYFVLVSHFSRGWDIAVASVIQWQAQSCCALDSRSQNFMSYTSSTFMSGNLLKL